MDKKITYYIIAAIVLVAVIAVIIVMQKPNTVITPEEPKKPTTINNQPVKTESDVIKEVAQKFNLSDGQLPMKITIEDNNQSASLTPGKYLVLMLGADYDWKISSNNEKVLAKRDVAVGDSRVQEVYQVVQAGRALLSATGTCKAKCTQPTATFSFGVEGVISETVNPNDLVK